MDVTGLANLLDPETLTSDFCLLRLWVASVLTCQLQALGIQTPSSCFLHGAIISLLLTLYLLLLLSPATPLLVFQYLFFLLFCTPLPVQSSWKGT